MNVVLKKQSSQVCYGWGLAEHHAGLRKGPSLRCEGREEWAGWLRLQHRLRLLRVVHLLLLVSHAKSLRRRHHGQLWLPHAGLVDPRRPSSRRIRADLGRVRSKRHRQDPLYGNVRYAEEHGSAVGVWQQVPESTRVQETHQDEYAGGRWRQSKLHLHAVRLDTRKPQYKDAMRWVHQVLCARKSKCNEVTIKSF